MDKASAVKRMIGMVVLGIALSAWASTSSERAEVATAAITQKIQVKRPAAAPGQSATQLSNGRWLLAGGRNESGQVTGRLVLLGQDFKQAETLSAKLSNARSGHTATVLPDGTVLIMGGLNASAQPIAALERFHPETGEVEAIGDVGVEARAQHTATLLMDGRVLIAGGVDVSSLVHRDAQLLDPRTWRVESIARQMDSERFEHLAALLPSDDVLLWDGKDQDREPVKSAELYRRSTSQFSKLEDSNYRTLVDQPYTNASPRLKASLPEANATGVDIGVQIAVLFSKRLAPQTLNTSTVTLLGPGGPIEAQVAAAEGGLLSFAMPKRQLLPGSRYTLFVQGAKDAQNRALPFTAIGFETRTIAPGPIVREPLRPKEEELNDADGEIWLPGAHNLSGAWRSGKSTQSLRQMPKRSALAKALYGKQVKNSLPSAPAGVTAIAGQVLKLNARPLANVTLSIGNKQVATDANGEFLLANVPAGIQTLIIDGGTADKGKRQYGRYEYRATIEAGKTNALPFVIWMTRLDTRHEINLPAPTPSEVVITNPRIPGLELHIPQGTVIRDAQGQIATKVSMTAIPVDQPPFPLPASFVPVYFTIQPGGAHLQGLNVQAAKGARLIYPNFSKAQPGERMDFWNYDAREKGWYVYGQGTVSADGRQIVPDEGVVIYEFSGAMITLPSNAPPEGPPQGDSSCPIDSGPTEAGDPVDCYTGLFMHERTDLRINDVIPIDVSRTYRPRDSTSRTFGIGTNLSYDMFLIGDVFPYTYQDLVMADGGRIHYPRTSPGTGYADAVYTNTSAPGRFYGSTLRWNTTTGTGWLLTLRDGTVYTFIDSYQSTTARCGAPTSMRDRNNNTVIFTRGSNCNLTKVTSPNGRSLSFTYDTSNRVTQVSDDIGRTVTYQYDTSGRLSTVTYPDNKTELYTYDTQHRMLTVTDRRGNVMVTNTYDANGRVSQQTYPDSTSSSFNYTLDGNNKVMQMDYTDERGTIERVQFNAMGFPTTITRAVGKPEQQILSFTRSSTTNLVQSQTDPLGRVTNYQHDSKGNLTQVTYLAGTAAATTWSYTYDPTFSVVASATDPLTHQTTYAYDTNGNLMSVVDALGHATSFTYDAAGRPTSRSRSIGGAPLTTTYSYVGGDLASVTDPLNRTAQFFMDGVGRLVTLKEASGNLSRVSYDSRDQIIQTTDPLGYTTQRTYDGNGNLLTFQDSRSNTTQFSYDTRNRLSSKTDPLNNVESYEYDASGNLKRVTDRKGQVSGYGYDFLNRRTSAGFGATVSNPTSYLSTIAYAWDSGNRLTDAVDSVSGTISRNFDGLDRLTQEDTPQGVVGYTYYANGPRQTMTVQGQTGVSYTYDNANRLTQVAQGSTVVGLSYDVLDRRTTLTLPNGVEVLYGYDAASQLTSLTYQKASTTIGNLTYAYDSDGRRTSVGGSFAQVNLPAAVTSGVHDAANRVTAWGTHTLGYDDNGALVSDADSTTQTYVWDERRRLKEIKQGTTTTASFLYDAFNRRTGKTIGGVSTNYLHDGWQIVQELSGTTVTANLLTGLRVDEIFRRTAGSTVEDFLTDALGSTIALTDATGAVQTTYSYEPYGKTSTSGAAGGSYQYTGRENDGGLYYYRNRYYSPTVGKFVSEDPIGLRGGANVYLYVSANPLRWIDPFGLCDVNIEGANAAEEKRSELAATLPGLRAEQKWDEVADREALIEHYKSKWYSCMCQDGKDPWTPPEPPDPQTSPNPPDSATPSRPPDASPIDPGEQPKLKL